MVIPILSVGFAYSMFFGTYRNTRRLIQIYRNDGETKDETDVKFRCDSKNSQWHCDIFVSGCVAGFIYSVANIPIESVKTMIKQSSSENKLHDKRTINSYEIQYYTLFYT